MRIGCLYKGSITYKMMAGMGDTIFGPMYEVLLKRGVDFKMFHWVSKLTPAADDDSIETIEIITQVDPTKDYPYLIDVVGLPCWPSEPSWDHITDGQKLHDAGVDLEQTANPLNREPTVLHRGSDFDQVVLGISIGGLQPVCADLGGKRNPRFQAMLDNLATVGTRECRCGREHRPGIWAGPRRSAPLHRAMPSRSTPTATCHTRFPRSIPCGEVNSIGYFCGPLTDGVDHAADVLAVKKQGIDFFSADAGVLWPLAVNRDGFEWDVLVDDQRGVGSARFDAQYWRANTQGTERYVTTQAGSVQYRLRPDDSGYTNLVLAGDWTRNGIDGGAVEAALASGRMASRALCGSPSYIPGEHGPLVDAQGVAEPPTYVDFGGLEPFPAPTTARRRRCTRSS